MDGLEVVEAKLSELERTMRIDAEFFKKENLVISNVLLRNNTDALTNLVNVSDGNHMEVSSKFQDAGIPYFRGQDIHSFFIEMSNPICIDENTFNLPYMKRSHLKNEDVLLSIVGTIGKVAIFTGETKATCNCKLAILRTEKINPEYLSIFLQSKYGNNQILKYTRGAVQMGFLLEDMQAVNIPLFSDSFVLMMQHCVLLAKKQIKQSEITYTSAETILLSHLGLDNYAPNPSGIAVKTLSCSFGTSGRFDSEYYQPKYEQILQAISSHHQKSLSGENGLVEIKKSIEPGSDYYGDEGIPFIRVSNLSKYEISEPDIKIPIDTVKEMYKLYPKRDTILLSKDGSVGIAHKVENDMDCVTSGAILHLTIKDTAEILPDYLTLVLNSKIVQMQAERDAGGSIIQHWKPSEISDVVIPVLDIKEQLEISDKVKESFVLRKKSTELLELAKTAVEIAIEQGENAAMKMLEGVV